MSNSSSCSFTIVNKTKENKSILDFAKEVTFLLDEFKNTYDWNKDDPRYSEESFLRSAANDDRVLVPGKNVVTFGDEDRTVHGTVFDYMLRDKDSSDSFFWELEEMLR